MSRPTEEIPDWSSDATFTDPPVAAGEPTKITPPTAYVEQGYQPTETPPAEFENWWKNLVGKWLRFVAQAQLRTFFLAATLDTINVSPRGLACSSTIAPTADADPWVAAGVGAAGDFRHSPTGFGHNADPEQWEAASDPPDITGAAAVRIEAVALGADEHLVSLTDNGIYGWTDDGDDWSYPALDSEGEPLYDVASNGTTVCILCRNVSADVDVFSSTDLANWTKRLVATLAVKLTGITWDGLRFIATGNSKTATSTNGTSWALVADPPANLYAIRSNPATNVSIAHTVNGDTLYRTTDGITWEALTAPGCAGENFNDFHFADGIWVIAREFGAHPEELVPAFWSADDGDTWNPIRLPMEVKAVAHGQGRWLLMGHMGADTTVYSSLVME